MAHIKLKSGESALLSPYRFDVKATGRSDLKAKIIEEADTYASSQHYMSIVSASEDMYSVALHEEQGYLLAESVWRHFQYVPNLIWCERIAGQASGNVVILVVRNGKIELDGEMPVTALASDIANAVGDGDEQFDIYVHGDVPITEHPSDNLGKINFEHNRVHRFITLELSLLDIIDFDKSDMTYKLSKALDVAGLTNILPIAVVVIIVLGLLGKFLFSSPEPVVEKQNVDEFKQYRLELQSGNPTTLLVGLINRVNELERLRSWKIVAVGTNVKGYDVILEYKAGEKVNLKEVRVYLERNSASIQYKANQVHIRDINIPKVKPFSDSQIVLMDDVIEAVMNEIPDNDKVTFSMDNMTNNMAYRSMTIHITFANSSLSEFAEFINQLNGLPLVLLSSEIRNQDSLYTIALNIKLLGV